MKEVWSGTSSGKKELKLPRGHAQVQGRAHLPALEEISLTQTSS